MGKFRITSPDGQTFEVTAPDGASQEEVMSYVQRNAGMMARPDAQPAPQPVSTPETAFNDALPTPENDFNNAGASNEGGYYRGLKDTPLGFTNLIGRGVQAIAPAGSSFEDLVKRTNKNIIEDPMKQREAAYQAGRQQRGEDGVDWSRLAGNLTMTAPLALATPAAATLPGAMAVGAGAGALNGAVQPVFGEDYWNEKGAQVAGGALTGAATNGALGAAGRMLKPNTSPEVRMLMDEGVTPTPGQIMGGAAKWTEEKARSIPVLGDAITKAQGRGVEQFNRAAFNRVLTPLGETLPEDVAVGREAVKLVQDKVHDAYGDVLSGLKIGVDQQFGQDVNGLKALAQNLVPERAQQFENILNNEVLSRFNNGMISGETMKGMESSLGKISRDLMRGSDQDASAVGSAVQELQSNLRELVARTNPQVADRLSSVNKAYANLARIETAAGGVGAEGGVFSPRQLSAAVRSGDTHVRHNNYASGGALMQDLTDAGRKVLSPSVPDSGTAGRMMPVGLGYLAASNPGAAAAVLGATPMYSEAGQKLAAALLAGQRPAVVQKIGEMLQSLAKYAPAGSPSVYRATR